MSLYHWIWLTQQVPNPNQSNRLLEAFQKPDRVYSASEKQLRETGILSHEQCFNLAQARSLDSAMEIMNYCLANGIHMLSIHDVLYPERLRNISNPPLLLYVRGKLPLFDDLLCLALVGTRHASPTSLRNAENFAYALGRRGVCHISGMADGIDSAGHNGALRAGAMSVAVFGCGVDVCYPASNRRLMDRLEETGCIISEYAPGTKPTRSSFPQRNRIIAGLSTGVLVFAAPYRSGSLITANLALEFGRDVFVIPGGISDPEYAGANSLIKDGATPVTSPKDILDYYQDSVIFSDAYPSRVPQSGYEATREELRRIRKQEEESETTQEDMPVTVRDLPDEEPVSRQESFAEASDTEAEIPADAEPVTSNSEPLSDEASVSAEPISSAAVNAFATAEADFPLEASVESKVSASDESDKSDEPDESDKPQVSIESEVSAESNVSAESEEFDTDEQSADSDIPVFREVPFSLSLAAWKKARAEYVANSKESVWREWTPETDPSALKHVSDDSPNPTADYSESAEVLSEYSSISENDSTPSFPPLAPADATELRTAVYEAVCGGISIPDVLISRLNRPIDDVLGALADLEILGYLRSMPGGNMKPNLK